MPYSGNYNSFSRFRSFINNSEQDLFYGMPPIDNSLTLEQIKEKYKNADWDSENIEIPSSDGDVYLAKEIELEEIISNLIKKVLGNVGTNLYDESLKVIIQKKEYDIQSMEHELMKYIDVRIDRLVEDIALKLINSKIEEEVKKRVDDRISQIIEHLGK